MSLGYCFPLGDTGCLGGGYPTNELESCAVASGCACPMGCFTDTGVGGKICEMPCQSSDACGVAEICRAGSCEINFCAQDLFGRTLPGPRFFDGCDADGTNPVSGTCQPLTLGAGSAATVVGLCLWNGSRRDRSKPALPRECRWSQPFAGDTELRRRGPLCGSGSSGNLCAHLRSHEWGRRRLRRGTDVRCRGAKRSAAGALRWLFARRPEVALAPNDCCSGGCDTQRTGTCL